MDVYGIGSAINVYTIWMYMVLVKQKRDCRIVIRDYRVIKSRIKAKLFKKSINSFEGIVLGKRDRIEVMGLTNQYNM